MESGATDWVTVFTPLNDMEANVVASRLEDAGIRAVITGQSAMSGVPVSFGSIAKIEIKVPVEQEYDAVEVLIDLGYLEVEEDDEE